jgi:hypothetical protein
MKYRVLSIDEYVHHYEQFIEANSEAEAIKIANAKDKREFVTEEFLETNSQRAELLSE